MWKKIWAILKPVLMFVPSILIAVYYVFYVRGNKDISDGERVHRIDDNLGDIGDLSGSIRERTEGSVSDVKRSNDKLTGVIGRSEADGRRIQRAKDILERAKERSSSTGKQ